MVKCVCPMGGDRTCPNDCPLAIWANMPTVDRKKQRKPIAEKLYKQGFTQEQIATQLGVTQWTISQDLRNLEVPSKLKPSKTETNPKGAGRPKGSKTAAPKPHPKADKVLPLRDQGLSTAQIAAETGVPKRQVRHIVEEESIRREAVAVAEPEIDVKSLSMSAQQKVDAAIRQRRGRLEAEFAERVRLQVVERANELAAYLTEKVKKEQLENQQTIALARQIMKRKGGLLSKATYNLIRSCLHPDSRKSVSDEKLNRAFHAFTVMEKLIGEDDLAFKATMPDLPKTPEEWMALKRKVAEANRAKRAAKKNGKGSTLGARVS